MPKELLRKAYQQKLYDHIEMKGYCSKCQVVKEPRTHHCRIANRCIIRMDHFCPWVGNCIGIRNHKIFVQFLFYGTIDLTIGGLLQLYLYLFTNFPEIDELQRNMLLVSIATDLISGLAIGYLFWYQCMNLKDNITTVEDLIPQMHESNPFDRGSWLLNVEEVFGPFSWYHWLLPTLPQLKNGYMFNYS